MPPPKHDPRRRQRAWMPMLARIDQTWYAYEYATKNDMPRWVAHTDPEWMRGRLRQELGGLWYVKTRRLQSGNEWWSPDTRTLAMVEDALADELNAGTGTTPRELPDIYDQRHAVYSGGIHVLVCATTCWIWRPARWPRTRRCGSA